MANLRADNLTGTGGRNAIDGSLFFDGNYDGLAIPSIAFGSGNWTVEFWFYMTKTSSNNQHIYDGRGTGSASSAYPIIRIDTNEKLSYYTAGAGRITGNTTIQVGSWNHVAFVKNSGTLTAYLNGVSEGTYSDSNTYIAPSNSIGRIGSDDNGSSYYFYGFLSNFRVVNGTAVYTAAFTPPTEKLTAVDDTVLLCCQDSDDATQEATGKTITGYGRYFAATGELFANTGFTADSDWNKGAGWTISGGVATHAQGSAGDLDQQISGLVVGQTYKLSVDILTTDNDVAYFFIDNNPGGNYPTLTSADTSPVGYHQIFFNANATTMYLGFRGSSLWAGTLTNLRLSSADRGKLSKVLPSVGVDEGVVFEGDMKMNSQSYMYFPTGDTTQRGRGRGMFISAMNSGNWSNAISYIQIQTLGEVKDFGDLIYPRRFAAGTSSATRGVIGAGIGPSWPANKTTEYSTLATTGNATSFGELLDEKYGHAAFSNSTRGIFTGGYSPSPVGGNVNVMEYITFATTGDSIDFGDQTDGSSYATRYIGSGISNGTRGIIQGGYTGGGYVDTIVYVPNISSLSNTSDFGNLSNSRAGVSGCSDTTRGIFFGGYAPSPVSDNVNTIEYITIATTGDATDFGDLTTGGAYGAAVSNSIRGVVSTAGGTTNIMNYVNIQTTGNAQDFGDLNTEGGQYVANSNFSDSHGGLS